MKLPDKNVQKLKAGEHFGKIGRRHYFKSAIISESVYPNQTSLPKHSHELGFFTLVIDGNYFDKLSTKEDSFDPMTVVWREREITHKDRIGRNGGRFFFVEIKYSSLNKLSEYEKPPERLIQRNGELTWLALRLRREIQMAQSSSPLIVEGITLEMLGHLTRIQKTVRNHPPDWLDRVVEKLNEDFAKRIRIDEIAMEAGVHPTKLTRTFRHFQKCSIGEYIQKLRVLCASKKLLDREMPLAEIALESGFSDQSHFTRIFKRLTGTTPAAFRNNLFRR